MQAPVGARSRVDGRTVDNSVRDSVGKSVHSSSYRIVRSGRLDSEDVVEREQRTVTWLRRVGRAHQEGMPAVSGRARQRGESAMT